MIRNRLGFLRNDSGAAAVEFALVIGFVMITVLGVINGGLMLYTYSNLHMTVENTARWASIRATVDGAAPTSTAVQTAGAGFYKGATAAPTFTATSASCGMQVTGATTFPLSLGLGTTALSMSATACHPLG